MKLKSKTALLFTALMAMFGATAVYAGTTGTEFQPLYQQLYDWISGYLGRAIAIAGFIIGAGIGIARQNPIPALVGVVFALFMIYIPAMINSIMTGLV